MRVVKYRGSYYAAWQENGQIKRRALRTKDRDAAERAIADFRRSVAIRPDTVDGILESYIMDREAIGKRSTPSMRYAQKPLAPFFGHLRPDQITRELCRSYMRMRISDGRKPGTVRKELGTLAAALKWHDPQHKAIIELPAAPPPKDVYLTKEEFGRLLKITDTYHTRLFMMLAISTAARAEAILDLTWGRVDFQRGLIRLALDGESERDTRKKGRATVPMTQSLRQVLEEAHQISMTDWVIEYRGKRVLSIKKSFARAVEKARFRNITPHILRHTAAVWMAEARVPMSEIAQYLGHSDDGITQRVYARYSPEFLRNAADALEMPEFT